MFLFGIYVGGLVMLFATFFIARNTSYFNGELCDLGGIGGCYGPLFTRSEKIFSVIGMFLWPIIVPLVLIGIPIKKRIGRRNSLAAGQV